MPNLSDTPEIADAYDYIRNQDVRDALGHLVLMAKAQGRSVRLKPHGYMQRVYSLALPGVKHPEVVVYREYLTLYRGPYQQTKIRGIADVPDDLFDR